MRTTSPEPPHLAARAQHNPLLLWGASVQGPIRAVGLCRLEGRHDGTPHETRRLRNLLQAGHGLVVGSPFNSATRLYREPAASQQVQGAFGQSRC
jgi:hypothetical protein